MYIFNHFNTNFKFKQDLSTPILEGFKMEDIQELLHISRIEDSLKRIRRTGWQKGFIVHSETVAEHLHHTAIVSIYLMKVLDLEIDWEKVLLLSLTHDMAEAYIGDIPYPEKTDEDREMENKYLRDIYKVLGLEDLVDEVDKRETIEHLIYKFSELTATYLQGIIYLSKGFRDQYIHEIVTNMLDRLESIAIKLKNEKLSDLLEDMKKLYQLYLDDASK